MRNAIITTTILLIINSFSPVITFAQTDTVNQKSMQVSFLPQYLIQHGVRIDIEPLFKNGKHSLQISPQFYYNENEIYYNPNPLYYDKGEEYDKMIGYGIALHHKIFAHYSSDKRWAVYFAYGGEYAHFTMNYKSWEWIEYTEAGLQYMEYDLIDVQQNTDRIRVNLLLGIQFNYVENLFLDFYIGTGGVYSINEMNTTYAKPILTDGAYQYAYTGIYIPLGFKFGFRF